MLMTSPPYDFHDFSNIHCHCEPFAPVTLTPMQSGEESRGAQDRLREAISISLFEIATPACRNAYFGVQARRPDSIGAPRNDIIVGRSQN